MEIRFIRHQNFITEVYPKGHDRILEVSAAPDTETGFRSLALYDISANRLNSIAEDIEPQFFIPTYNCIMNSPDVYYSVVSEVLENNINVEVFRYSPDNNKVSCILSFTESRLFLSGYKKIKIFILSSYQVLVQTEHQKDWEIHALMGNIEFVLNLYDIKSNACQQVSDINLTNNGINTILPVTATEVLIKTGYPFLEDERISGLSEEEALIESIYFGSMAMFISAMQKSTIGSDLKLLNTVYFDKGIIDPKVSGDYIFYTVINYKESLRETCFYNYLTGEQKKVMSSISDISDLKNAYVIDNIPYIRNTYEDRTEFFNINTSETDCIFYDEQFAAVLGDFFIFQTVMHSKNYLRIYRYPGLEFVCEEKGSYRAGCLTDGDYYIYLED